MFISVLELYKVGIGPSSSHTMGPMQAALLFKSKVKEHLQGERSLPKSLNISCRLCGSLAHTGKGHASDHAVILGLHGYSPKQLVNTDIAKLVESLKNRAHIEIDELGGNIPITFDATQAIIFDCQMDLPQHPNGIVFTLEAPTEKAVLSETYFSIGGGFVLTKEEISGIVAPLRMGSIKSFPFPFDSAKSMLRMARENALTIAAMKRANELHEMEEATLNKGLDEIWQSMQSCVESGLAVEGKLPGKLNLSRRAKGLFEQVIASDSDTKLNDLLCSYAMAVNEENAAGHMVVTAPTNGAAGVVAAVLYYCVHHHKISQQQIHDFLLTSAAIGGIIKHRSSISGAEVGCQGEVGSASSMAAAGLAAIRGGSCEQIENAAEIALEHHLGMTCDPVAGLVQVPCIERNGFGAIKAFTAASLALRGSGQHLMPLDSCIAAMKQTGLEMSEKFKETSLGGLAVNITEC